MHWEFAVLNKILVSVFKIPPSLTENIVICAWFFSYTTKYFSISSGHFNVQESVTCVSFPHHDAKLHLKDPVFTFWTLWFHCCIRGISRFSKYWPERLAPGHVQEVKWSRKFFGSTPPVWGYNEFMWICICQQLHDCSEHCSERNCMCPTQKGFIPCWRPQEVRRLVKEIFI